MSATAYLDSSALVKLVYWEPETDALLTELEDRQLFSCSLALTEVPRAVQRIADADKSLSLTSLLAKANEVLESINLIGLDNGLLTIAGAIGAPKLRSLDAIHVAAASALPSVGRFYTYDSRQSEAAGRQGLPVVSPR